MRLVLPPPPTLSLSMVTTALTLIIFMVLPPSSHGVELRYLSILNEGTNLHLAEEYVTGLYSGSVNPNVTIRRVAISSTEGENAELFLDMIAPPMASADVLYGYTGSEAREAAAEGKLTDLTFLWEKYNWTGRVPETQRVSARGEDGKFYFAPILMDGFPLLYLSPLFPSGGFPQTWDALLEFCEGWKFSTGAACVSLYGFPTDAFAWFDYINWRLHGAEFHQQWLDGQIAFTSPQVNATLSTLRDFITAGYLNTNGNLTNFYTGESPILMFGEAAHKFAALTPETAPLLAAIQAAPFPALNPNVPITGAEGMISLRLCVPTSAVHHQPALDFVEYYSSPAGLASFFAAAPYTQPVIEPENPGPMDHVKARISDMLRHSDHLFFLSWEASKYSLIRQALAREFAARWFYAVGTLLSDAAYSTDDLMRNLEATRIEAVFSQAVTPTASHPAGAYADPVSITLSTRTPEASVYYTLDGSPPFEGSLKYRDPIPLQARGESLTLRAVAIRQGLKASELFEGIYSLDEEERPPAVVAPREEERELASSPAFIGALSATGLLLCCLLLLGWVCISRRSRKVTYSLTGDDSLVIPYEKLTKMREVGAGSFGTVFAAEYRASTVAVKVLHDRELAKEVISSFMSEAQIMLSLRHANIVMFMGASLEPLALVTEFMERGSLYDIIHNDALDLSYGLRIKLAQDVARGMAFLHDGNMLHRDMKSLNVLIDENWVAKVADFGLTELVEDTTMEDGGPGGPPAPGTDSAMGSLFWSAPEVLDDPEAFDRPADVFAFGITMWELFSRCDLYAGSPPYAVALGVQNGSLRPSLDALSETVTPNVVDLMEACWAQEPKARPSFVDIVQVLTDARSDVEVTIPVGSDYPEGDSVIVAKVALVGCLDLALTMPEAVGDALMSMHDTIEAAVRLSRGLVFETEINCVSVAFFTPRQFFKFHARLRAALEVIEWAPLLLLRMAATLPPVTVAASMGPVDAHVDRGSLEVTYTGETVEDVGGVMKRTPPGATHVSASLYDAAIDITETKDTGFTPTSDGDWRVDWGGNDGGSGYGEEEDDGYSSGTSKRRGLAGHTSLGSMVGADWSISRSTVVEFLERAERKGMGSYSECYVGEWRGGTTVLLKKLLQQRQAIKPRIVFFVEFCKLQSVNHPSLLPLEGACFSLPYMAIVAPYHMHGSLGDLVYGNESCRLTATDKERIMLSVAHGLAHLHSNNLIFAGLKPANVLLTKSQNGDYYDAVLSDYALAGLKSNMGTMTVSQTARYEAPELLRGEPSSSASDMFSFGTVMFEMWTEEPLFPMRANAMEVAHRILAGMPHTDMSSMPDVIPEHIARIILSCWDLRGGKRAAAGKVVTTMVKHQLA